MEFKLSRPKMFLNHTPHEFSQKPVGKYRLRNNHVCGCPVRGRNANCQDFKCLSIKLHMKKFPTIMSENGSWQAKQSISVHIHYCCKTKKIRATSKRQTKSCSIKVCWFKCPCRSFCLDFTATKLPQNFHFSS